MRLLNPINVPVFCLAVLLMLSGAASAAENEAGLRLAPKAFRTAAEKALPHVVKIETVGGISMGNVTGQQGQRGIGLTNPGEGPTTGVILSEDGHIITSTFNFLRKQRIITVTLPDGTKHVARQLGRDEMRKLVLLKVEVDQPLQPATFMDPQSLRVGQWAVSVGLGYGGEEPAISSGIISALGRAHGRAVQTDANISPANYGGPLIDIEGRIIGICTPLNPRVQGDAAGSEWYDSGIGFAIPLHDLDHLVERMKAGETLARGFVGFQPATEPVDSGGVRVERVVDNTPASGVLEAEDVITAIDGQPTGRLYAMQVELARFAAGDTIVVSFKRDGKPMDARITLAEAPRPQQREGRRGPVRVVPNPGNEEAPEGEAEPNAEAEPDAEAEAAEEAEPDAESQADAEVEVPAE